MRRWLIVLLLLLLLAGVAGFFLYSSIFGPNVDLGEQDQISFYVKTGDNLEDLKSGLSSDSILKNQQAFIMVAKLMKFTQPKPGLYELQDGMSTRDLISMFRSGRQKALKLTFNNFRKIEDLIGYFGSQLESDSISLAKHFLSRSVKEKYGITKENLMSLFIPNTYQIYWNTSPEKLLARLAQEREKFFDKERMTKAKNLDLTKEEIYTLASIVQKETLVNSEKPRVAGVYINRLKRGQLLQADPTVVFANGDFELRRVLNKHLAIDSPYNTYKYEGLPPGPICMPDVSSIDAVLNYEKHKYLYFCASPDNSGRHLFAKSLIEHNRNADKYRAYLNKQRIFR